MVAISPDLKHDAAAAAAYCELAHYHLKEEYGVTQIIHFSDCCAGQYRGKVSFADISLSPNVEHHYYESCHGKSAADGLSAVVKHAVTYAVTKRKALVRNAREFFDYCTENLTQVAVNAAFPSQKTLSKNSSRKFFYLENVNRDRPQQHTKTVKGTMKIHSARGTGQPYQIRTRQLSCFCSFCRKGLAIGTCQNESYVGRWTTHNLQCLQGIVSFNLLVSIY